VAAQNASSIFAFQEAIVLARRGLALVETTPESLEKTKRELSLQLILGPALVVTRGWGSQESLTTYARAMELCQVLGNPPELFEALWGIFAFHVVRAEHRNAHALADRLLLIARQSQANAHFVMAQWAAAAPSFYLGDFEAAREQLERAHSLYDPREHDRLAWVYAQDPEMGCLAYWGLVSWYLGHADEARAKVLAASAHARRLSHPFSLGYALLFEIYLCQLLRDMAATRARLQELQSLAEEYDFALFRGYAMILRGWTSAEEGEKEHGIQLMSEGLAALDATGQILWRPYHLALVAEGHMKAGDIVEARGLIADALETALETDERYYEAELHRLKGELLMSDDLQRESEDAFHRAIQIARKQSALSLELRATMSLSRLWQRQGRGEEARRVTFAVYGRFTEGFDTADLKEAGALIQELS
jgi:predicted ATPase